MYDQPNNVLQLLQLKLHIEQFRKRMMTMRQVETEHLGTDVQYEISYISYINMQATIFYNEHCIGTTVLRRGPKHVSFELGGI